MRSLGKKCLASSVLPGMHQSNFSSKHSIFSKDANFPKSLGHLNP